MYLTNREIEALILAVSNVDLARYPDLDSALTKLRQAYKDPHFAAFDHQRRAAKQHGIVFNLTFVQWLNIWEKSGHLADRGRGSSKYAMVRIGNEGPYSEDNVQIVRFGDYVRERSRTKKVEPTQEVAPEAKMPPWLFKSVIR